MEFKAINDGTGLSISLHTPPSGVTRSFAQRRRNRHGRGFRGPVIPAGMPAHRTRGEVFEDYVVESADRLRTLWPLELAAVEYLVEEVPGDLEALLACGKPAPLGLATPASGAQHAVIAVYRHPIEGLCDVPGQVRELVHEVLIEQVAVLLNIDPDRVDPTFHRFRRRG